ncbi:MAG TPA: MerR family transcriptional regulator [Gaiellaceae bacterium]|nr:MerR family transcriptional regulator [Gaiellaceae bacterium]
MEATKRRRYRGPRRTLLNLSEAAEVVGISGYTLASWARRGLVPVIRLEGGERKSRLYFRREDVERIAEPRLLNDEPNGGT